MRISLLLLFFSFFLNGCGIIDYYLIKPPEDTAQEIFENARASMQEKEYPAAIDSLTKLYDRYPFSPYAVDSRIMLADAYFLDREYVEAIDVYDEFLSMHPRHQSIDYVIFQIGVCKYRLHKSIDLPQTDVAEALEMFKRLVDGYPGSTHANDARGYIAKCRLLLAEHEMYVADFYFKAEEYRSAWTRYTYLLDNFPEITKLADLARPRAKVAYFYAQEQENKKRLRTSIFKPLLDWL